MTLAGFACCSAFIIVHIRGVNGGIFHLLILSLIKLTSFKSLYDSYSFPLVSHNKGYLLSFFFAIYSLIIVEKVESLFGTFCLNVKS